jgi:hypothetical protein
LRQLTYSMTADMIDEYPKLGKSIAIVFRVLLYGHR